MSVGGWRRSRSLKLVQLAVAAALLYYIFRVVPFADVMRSLRSAQRGKVAAGLTVLLVMRVIAAVRMKLLTDKQGLSFSLPRIFEIGTTATFYGLLLPGALSGGLIRWYKLARQGDPVRALASLSWDRLADVTMVAVIGAAFWLGSRPAGGHTAVGPALLAAAAALAVLYLAGFSRGIGELLLRPIETAGRRLRPNWARAGVGELAAAARRYHEVAGGFSSKVIALSLASQLAGAAAFFLWARSLGAPVGFAELGWARSSYLLVELLPITFAGLGAREGVLLLLLQPYGVSGAECVALSFLQLGGTLVMAALGGLFELRSLWTVQPPAETTEVTAPTGHQASNSFPRS